MPALHLVLLFLLCACPRQGEAETLEPDLTAMRSLAAALGADRVAGWTTTSDPCSWKGVGCHDGRVTAIQLGNRGLVGTLPAVVANLTALTRLELQENSLSGMLPSLSGLSLLQFLLLNDNNFTAVPANFFSGLSSLQAAYLDNNPFSAWQIPATLSDASNLVNFSAINANVTGLLPDFLALKFQSLERLALSLNDLSGPVPAAFATATSLRALWLNNQKGVQLSGGIGFVPTMTSLQELWLQSNNFSGSLPDFSNLTDLWDLQLRDNKFTGLIPASLLSLRSLKNVALTNNPLQGPTPAFTSGVKVDAEPGLESFCLDAPGKPCDPRVTILLSAAEGFYYPLRFADSWKGNDPCNSWMGVGCDDQGNITIINFNSMGLTGRISPEFSKITSLQKLSLADNNISGNIPVELTQLPLLTSLDVSNNDLWGKVPPFKSTIVITRGNLNIGKDGPPSSGSSGNVPGAPTPTIDGNSAGGKRSSSSVGIIVGVVVGAVALLAAAGIGYFCYKRNRKPGGRVQSPTVMVIHPRHSGSDQDVLKITVAGRNSNLNGGSSTSDQHSPASGRHSDIHVVEAGNMVISIQVLRNVTNNFSEENVIGRGGFGTVYKGELHDGTKIAVKRMEAGVMGNKGLNEFKSEISVLTKVRHRNLVSLLGYCLDGNERILVYEYMPQGALSKHVFDWKVENLRPLEWKRRLSIALDVARGVEYLHSLAHQSFIHRDLKPSNILLSDDMKAKVADFGLVRLAPSDGKHCSVETKLAGTFGYLAPEYAVTGRVTTKSDVYSYGVILMELITGRKALDETEPEESMHLVTWFRRIQLNKDTFPEAIDRTIALDEETLASVTTVAELAGHCCAREPQQRPDMGHAVNVLSTLVEVWKPTDQDSDESYGIDLDMTLPQALKKWQAFEDNSRTNGATSSFLASLDNTQTSIPTRPPGFAESFTSTDGR